MMNLNDSNAIEELKQWMIKKFKYSWHKKYQTYFDMWYDNLTTEQINGFFKQMNTDIL